LEEPPEQTYLLLLSHQPDRLLPTIRSRCLNLIVSPPAEDDAVGWLGLEEGPQRDALMLLSGRSPFRALELMAKKSEGFIKDLEDKLRALSENRLDARTLADDWVRHDPELALEWLVRRLQHAIRQIARV